VFCTYMCTSGGKIQLCLRENDEGEIFYVNRLAFCLIEEFEK